MEKPRRTRTNKVIIRPAVESNVLASWSAKLTDGIPGRAYELYCERGGEHGHDVEDWLRAERELREPISVAVARG